MKSVLSIMLLITAVLLAACGARVPAATEDVSYTIEMSEYAFSPAELRLKVGQKVTLELVNKGQIEHEFMVGREVKITDNRPDGFQQEMFADMKPVVVGGLQSAHGEMGGHAASHSGFMVILPKPGETATITFTVLKEMVGEWEIGCFSQEGVHYDVGMHARLVIEE